MSTLSETGSVHPRRLRHRGRGAQVLIYLGKQFRFFINQSDWKVLPLAAVIAALVSMVIRRRLFVNMEGSLIGAFALTCVAIWNGCFNSIQSVCRERPILKREHRSGLHITSYVAAHMIYQLFLCLTQTVLTLLVMSQMGVRFDLGEPVITRWIMVDVGITLLLISYASDMMSLLISSVAHTTTGAMTVMPFVLIFQLVFSGGIIPLPPAVQPLSSYTISTYGIKALASQSGYNEREMVAVWNTLSGMRDTEIDGTVTLGQVMDLLESPVLDSRDDMVLVDSLTVRDLTSIISQAMDMPVDQEALDASPGADEAVTDPITLGQLRAFVRSSPALAARRDRSFTVNLTLGEIFEMVGEEDLEHLIKDKTREASQNPSYDRTAGNIVRNWTRLGLFTLVFAAAAVIVLELIDRDKR